MSNAILESLKALENQANQAHFEAAERVLMYQQVLPHLESITDVDCRGTLEVILLGLAETHLATGGTSENYLEFVQKNKQQAISTLDKVNDVLNKINSSA